jgi:hypothetical protein
MASDEIIKRQAILLSRPNRVAISGLFRARREVTRQIGEIAEVGEGVVSQKDKGAAEPFDCALDDRPSTGEGKWAAGCFQNAPGAG